MRLWPLLLLTTGAGCADVQHALVRLERGRLAYRLSVVPHVPLSWDVDASLSKLPSGPDAVVRAWTEHNDGRQTVIVHGQFSGVAAFAQWRDQVWTLAEQSWGDLPLAFSPPIPTLTDTDDSWLIDVDVPASKVQYQLVLGGDHVTPKAPRTLDDGAQLWSFPPGIPGKVHAAIRPRKQTSLAGWLKQGGPSAAAALAGLAMLLWVNRRMRRRRYQRARAGGR